MFGVKVQLNTIEGMTLSAVLEISAQSNIIVLSLTVGNILVVYFKPDCQIYCAV